MTDPTPVDDVIVTGQRSQATSPFADIQWPSKGVGSGGVNQQEVSDDPNPEPNSSPSDESVQCADSEGRKQWNADAKAAEAARRFRDAAQDRFNEPDLQNREFGALICEMQSGTITLSDVYAGDPLFDEDGNLIPVDPGLGRPTVDIPTDGCGVGTPIGWVHSHPDLSNGVPSDPDFAFTQRLANENNVSPDTIGIYVVSQFSENGQSAQGVRRSEIGERQAANTGAITGALVNPAAEPCPGDS